MAKKRALVAALGAGFFFSMFCLFFTTISHGNLSDPCTVREFLYAFRFSGAKEAALISFAGVGYFVYQVMAGRGNGVLREPLKYADVPRGPEFNSNGIIMHSPNVDAMNHIRGDIHGR